MPLTKPLSLAIVIPAYNEEACIVDTVRQWGRIARGVNGIVIVVDDGSRDGTAAKLDALSNELEDALRVMHQPNSGHGPAVYRGYQAALQSGAEFVFQTDSDGQFEPEDFWSLWQRRWESPFILGRRSDRKDSATRRWISKSASILASSIFGVRQADYNIPFRLMSAPFLAALLKWIDRGVFAPNFFMSILARLAQVDTLDIPVHHFNRTTGKASIVGWKLIRSCLLSFLQLLRFRAVTLPRRSEIRNLSLGLKSVPLTSSQAVQKR